MRMLLVVVLCLFLTGCATGYGRTGFTGGYKETKIQDNVYKVVFQGNGYTSGERASDFALLRSAEITLEKGNKYFILLDSTQGSKQFAFTTPVTSHTTGSVNTFGNTASYSGNTYYSGGQTFVGSKPSSSLIIQCFVEKPQTDAFVYDAEQVCKNIKETYKIKDKPNATVDLPQKN